MFMVDESKVYKERWESIFIYDTGTVPGSASTSI